MIPLILLEKLDFLNKVKLSKNVVYGDYILEGAKIRHRLILSILDEYFKTISITQSIENLHEQNGET